jgi:hypothetical protein
MLGWRFVLSKMNAWHGIARRRKDTSRATLRGALYCIALEELVIMLADDGIGQFKKLRLDRLRASVK